MIYEMSLIETLCFNVVLLSFLMYVDYNYRINADFNFILKISYIVLM